MAVIADQITADIAGPDAIQARLDESMSSEIIRSLRIAACLPELDRLQRAMCEETSDAAYILLRYIVEGLQAQGHHLTFVSQRDLNEPICTQDLQQAVPALLTWSGSRWFEIARKCSWRIQLWLGIPYLNVFTSLRHFDAFLQCLPGHHIVYERNGLYMDGAARACKRLGLPYVLFVDADEIMEHDYMGEPITGILRWRASRMFQFNLDAADCVICVSEQSKKHLIAAWHVPSEKVAVFPNGVDIERFRPHPETRAQVRDQLGVSDNPMIIFVGSFYPWHDVATLLAAFAQVLATYPDARLVLVGDGTQRHIMMQRAVALGIDHAARFVGIVSHSEIPQVISAADVAVAPYPKMDRDLWLSPMKLYEYMASGAPIVASAIGQIIDVITDGKNGLLVPAEDPTAMASAIKGLLGDPALRSQLGSRARNDAVHKHSWDRYLARLGRVLSAVHSGRPVPLL